MTIEQVEEIINEVVENDGFECDQTREIRKKVREIMEY